MAEYLPMLSNVKKVASSKVALAFYSLQENIYFKVYNAYFLFPATKFYLFVSVVNQIFAEAQQIA